MTDQENGLPVGWVLTTLGQVCKTTSGGTPSRKFKEYFQGDIPWVKSGELPDNVISTVEEYITKEALINSSAKLFPEDTLLIALYGATVGKLGILKKTAATNQAVCAIFPKVDLCTKYLFWYLRFIRSYLISQAVGGAQPNINQSILQNLPIYLAPLPEQHRIVAEIEKQFSRLDEAVSGLKRIQANLKRYRASVLKSAVEGKLTAEWRKKHPDTEPAEQLLQRILKERRAHWEQAELEKMQAAGKPPKDELWKQKYKDPVKPDVSDLPTLPEGWIWVSLLQIGDLNRGKSKHRPRNAPILYDGIYPFIQTGDVRNAKTVIKSYTQTYSEEGLKQSKLWNKGTLCITIAANIADTGILGFDACFPDSVVGFVPTKYTDVHYIEYLMRTIKEDLERFAPATAQKNINLTILNDVAIPFPPKEEQQVLLNEIERRLSIADEVEQQINTNLKRAERLRQSILKKAFSGRLVPQDPNDEPAGVLLEKIKQAQRA